jgi:outer membrane biosynthesis protein TonB
MRIIIALWLSVLINGWIWSKSGQLFENRPIQDAKSFEQEDLLLLRLAPPPDPKNDPKSLINTIDRGEKQSTETKRISEFDSNAADNKSSEDQDDTPRGEPDEDMEVMPAASNPVPPAPLQKEMLATPKTKPLEKVKDEETPEPTPDEAKEENSPEPIPEEPEEEISPEPIVEAKEIEDGLGEKQKFVKQVENILEELLTPTEEEKTKKTIERIEVAKSEEAAEKAPSVPEIPIQGERNSPLITPGQGAEAKGFINFSANSHEMAPYMKEIQKRVRRYWLAGVQMKYPGSTRAKARVKCSIRPDGTLEFVEPVEGGGSLTFSLICQEAIRRAAPFPKFPFDVPEIYRNENLEITWTFSYL